MPRRQSAGTNKPMLPVFDHAAVVGERVGTSCRFACDHQAGGGGAPGHSGRGKDCAQPSDHSGDEHRDGTRARAAGFLQYEFEPAPAAHCRGGGRGEGGALRAERIQAAGYTPGGGA